MTTSVPNLAAVAKSVHVDDTRLTIMLADGRELVVPLSWFPRLQQGTAEERAHSRLIGGGVGVHWPDVDEDISVPVQLGLPCE